MQEALREATERIRAAQLREDEAAEALSSAMERREQDRQELERAFARKAAEEQRSTQEQALQAKGAVEDIEDEAASPFQQLRQNATRRIAQAAFRAAHGGHFRKS